MKTSTLSRSTKPMISEPLHEAQKQIEVALGRFSPVAGSAWIGSWAEYRNLVRINLKLAALIRKIERGESWEAARK